MKKVFIWLSIICVLVMSIIVPAYAANKYDYNAGVSLISLAALTKSNVATVTSLKYKVDNVKNTIVLYALKIPYNTFKANIKAANKATYVILKADGKTAVTKENIIPGMKIKVTAENKTSTRTYTCLAAEIKSNDATVTSSEYKVDNIKNTIKAIKIPSYDTFKSNIKAANKATYVILKADGITEVTKGNIVPGMKIKVTAENKTSIKTYTVADPLGRESPKLIAFDIADAFDMAGNLSRVAEMPFDGCKFDAMDNNREGNGHGWLSLSVWGPENIDYNNYSQFIGNVKAIMAAPGSTLQNNFIRINNVPGTLDPSGSPYNWENSPSRDEMVPMWFSSDFNAVLNNWRVAAKVARDSGCKGILYDWEEYKADIFSYTRQSDAKSLGKSLAETRAQVRLRANQIMAVLNEEFPTMHLIIIPHLYNDYNGTGHLWDSFCDGLIEAADPQMRIIDGNEKYNLDTAPAFKAAYDWHYLNAPDYCPDREKYNKQVECGFGLWMNRDGWDTTPEDGTLTPSQWENRLKMAMSQSDTYTWVFVGGSGTMPNWWTGANTPLSYYTANNNARSWAKAQRGF